MDPPDSDTLQLPPQFENALSLRRAEIDEFQSRALERIAKSSYPLVLLLVENYCLELFDGRAAILFLVAAGRPASEIDGYGEALVIVENDIRERLEKEFGKSMPAERKRIYDRTVRVLESKRLSWLAKGRRAVARQVTVAQHTETNQLSPSTEVISGAASSSPSRGVSERSPGRSKPADRATVRRRRLLLKEFRKQNKLQTHADLALRLCVSSTALYGMVKSDRSRYGEETLSKVLEKLNVPPEQW